MSGVSRRRIVGMLGGLCAAPCIAPLAQGQSTATINVKTLGAFGDGKLPDLRQVREAIRLAGEKPGGATVFFPAGEYYLGAADEAVLLELSGVSDIRLVGDRATLSCRSVQGQSTMLQLAACRNIVIEGITFRDRGLNRDINWLGAAAVRLANAGGSGCEKIQIRNCTFESVLSAVICRRSEKDTDRTRCRGIELTNLSVRRSYYGLVFQDNGDDVVARGLRCNDVKRSYFPYGVSDHDIELDTQNNATGFTDVLIKCYRNDTSRIKARIKCRGKRSGDAIVALDHQHEKGRGTMRSIDLGLDIDDADCRLETVVLIRSFDPASKHERETHNRWDDISIDGDVRICDKTKLIDIATVSKTRGTLRIGQRLARNPRLPRSFPGFTVVGI